MDILFGTAKLRKQCSSNKVRVKAFGAKRAKLLGRRLDQLRAAPHLEVLRQLPGRCHELTGDRKGSFAIDLDGPYRLIFTCAADPPPTREDGGLDWSRITAIRLLSIEDYHG